MKSLFGGSAVIAAALIGSSFIFLAQPSIAEPLSFQQPKGTVIDSSKVEKEDKTPTSVTAASGENQPEKSAVAVTAAVTGSKVTPLPVTTIEPAKPSTTYLATAYSLSGRTATGQRVSKGIIAADPSVLPLGTRVRLEAGSYSGEYVVADTGGAVRGKKIDIWTPSSREANRFGRRLVKLTVLNYGPRRLFSRK